MTIEQIRAALKKPLPGWEGQRIMTSYGYEMNRVPKSDSKKAAVLLLLHPDTMGNLHIVYIKRPTNNPKDKHGGQISFPGGQVEKEDRDLQATALRETFEEVGIPSEKLSLLTQLTDLYVFVSDFLVSAFVGYIDHPPQFKPQPSEVAYIISHPLQNLLTHERKTKDLQIRERILKAVPYYDLNGESLWGATAMITSEFLELIRKANQEV